MLRGSSALPAVTRPFGGECVLCAHFLGKTFAGGLPDGLAGWD